MDFSDFDAFLEKDFSALQFTNELLKATNSNIDNNDELDISTSIKRINYDSNELSIRFNNIINNNSNQILNKINLNSNNKKLIINNLKNSIDFLQLSYNRLTNEVLDPYEKSIKLQQVLNKLHQTSTLLRDSLIFYHLVHRINNLTINNDNNDFTLELALQLSSLYYQIDICLNQNKNLKSLKIIKILSNDILDPNKIKLKTFLSLQLSKSCVIPSKIANNKELITNLSYSLYNLSPQDFTTTVQKIVLLTVTPLSQQLIKTLNSIKNFDQAFKNCCLGSYNLYLLEIILSNIKILNSNSSNTNLLNEFISFNKNSKNHSPKTIYWNSISNNFKNDLEISYNRGGPVGKNLIKHKDFMKNIIDKYMPDSTGDNDYKKNMSSMLKSISILDKA